MLAGTILTVLVWIALCSAESQIFRNAGFEGPLGSDKWSCNGCTGSQYGDDKVEGAYSMLVQGRRAYWAGPSYDLVYGTDVISGQTYDFQIYVRLMADGSNRHDVKAMLSVTFSAYSKQVASLRIYMDGPAAGVDFLVDWSSLTATTPISLIHNGDLLENPGFEYTLDPWFCTGCTGVHYTADKHNGSAAMLAQDRSAEWAGPSQDLSWGSSVRGGQCYIFSAYLKVLGGDATTTYDTRATVAFTFSDGSSEYPKISKSFISTVDGWKKMEGDLCVPSYTKAVTRVKLSISGPPAGINLLVDDVFLHEVSSTLYSSWRTAADARIEQLRKRNVKIRVNTPNAANVEVQIVQTKSHFPFGSKINALELPVNTKYADYFFDNFEWGVMGYRMKWRAVEKIEGSVDWSDADPAFHLMESRGIKIRGHCLVWAVDKSVPDWLRYNPFADVQQKCFSRIDDAVGRFRGRVIHWDVNNEMLHGNFFVRRTGSPQIRYDMFRRVKENDPNLVPFLNDYEVVRSGAMTQAYVDQIHEFLDNGAPVEGVGAQCHFPKRPDPVMIKHRLDKIATAGLPIWVTELDVNEPDVTERADGLEDSLRVAFSHPAVEGIMLWGFWNETHSTPSASLVDGPNLEINEAGRRWRQLVLTDWRTNLSLTGGTMTSAGKEFDFRGFHGDYEVKVKSYGVTMVTKTFQLPPGDDTLVVDIDMANDIITG